jgi:hypothetical protein
MTLQEWNAMQIAEALGDVNRYFFWKHHNREPFDNDELVIYYIVSGGAESYNKNHKQERKIPSEEDQTNQQASSQIKKQDWRQAVRRGCRRYPECEGCRLQEASELSLSI